MSKCCVFDATACGSMPHHRRQTCCARSGMHRRHAAHAVLCTISAGKDSLLTWWASQQDVLRFDVSMNNALAVH